MNIDWMTRPGKTLSTVHIRPSAGSPVIGNPRWRIGPRVADLPRDLWTAPPISGNYYVP